MTFILIEKFLMKHCNEITLNSTWILLCLVDKDNDTLALNKGTPTARHT